MLFIKASPTTVNHNSPTNQTQTYPTSTIIMAANTSKSHSSDSSTSEQRSADSLPIRKFLKITEPQLNAEYNLLPKQPSYQQFYKDFENIKRCNYANIPMYDRDAVILGDGPNDFLHANWIKPPNEHDNNPYIIGQTPMVGPSAPLVDTQLNWYRLFKKQNVRVCVCLSNLGHETETKFFFNKTLNGTHHVKPFEVSTINVVPDDQERWTIYDLLVTVESDKKDFLLTVIVCEKWLDDPQSNRFFYNDLADLLQCAWDTQDRANQLPRQGVRAAHRKLPPTVVMSRAGMNRSGTFVAAAVIGNQIRAPNARTRIDLDYVDSVCKGMANIRYGVFERRYDYVLLQQVVLELGSRHGLVDRSETTQARRTLQKALEMSQSRAVAQGHPDAKEDP